MDSNSSLNLYQILDLDNNRPLTPQTTPTSSTEPHGSQLSPAPATRTENQDRGGGAPTFSEATREDLGWPSEDLLGSRFSQLGIGSPDKGKEVWPLFKLPTPPRLPVVANPDSAVGKDEPLGRYGPVGSPVKAAAGYGVGGGGGAHSLSSDNNRSNVGQWPSSGSWPAVGQMAPLPEGGVRSDGWQRGGSWGAVLPLTPLVLSKDNADEADATLSRIGSRYEDVQWRSGFPASSPSYNSSGIIRPATPAPEIWLQGQEEKGLGRTEARTTDGGCTTRSRSQSISGLEVGQWTPSGPWAISQMAPLPHYGGQGEARGGDGAWGPVPLTPLVLPKDNADEADDAQSSRMGNGYEDAQWSRGFPATFPPCYTSFSIGPLTPVPEKQLHGPEDKGHGGQEALLGGSGSDRTVQEVGFFDRSSRVGARPSRECKFCRNNGEPAAQYLSHVLRHPCSGRLICPVLRSHICETCGATGDNAHTRNYCPEVNREKKLRLALPLHLKSTRRQSNGQVRNRQQ